MAARDHLAMAALVRAVPVEDIERAVAGADRGGSRLRALPPWVVTYHVLASAMDPAAGIERVTDLLWATLPEVTGRGLARRRPTRAAVTRARQRLGVAPLRALLDALLARTGRSGRVRLERVAIAADLRVWALVSETDRLCGVDLRGDAMEAAALLVLGTGLTAPTTMPDPIAPPGVWLNLRTRTPSALRQEVVARACVDAATTIAITVARDECVTK